jgi:WD40 repeat protein
VTWSPDGKRVASASGDATVQVWDAATGATSLIYQGHKSPVFIAAWSPDGSKIASGDSRGLVQVWRAG